MDDTQAMIGRRESIPEDRYVSVLPPPGWYQDPDDSSSVRWWSGQHWTEMTRAVGWRHWVLTSHSARRISVIIAVMAGCGVLISSSIVLVDLVRDRPLPGRVAIALVVGIPTLIAGQLWMIGMAIARGGPRPRGFGARLRADRFSADRGAYVRLLFGDLGQRLVVIFAVLFVGGWLAAMTAFPALADGSPAGRRNGCPYRLENHGASTCVSKNTYEAAGAAEQRFAAGILLGFFSAHTAAALGRIRARTKE